MGMEGCLVRSFSLVVRAAYSLVPIPGHAECEMGAVFIAGQDSKHRMGSSLVLGVVHGHLFLPHLQPPISPAHAIKRDSNCSPSLSELFQNDISL